MDSQTSKEIMIILQDEKSSHAGPMVEPAAKPGRWLQIPGGENRGVFSP
jgi:hypothetical protein